MARSTVATWLLRLILAAILLPHGLGKLTYTDTFAAKFDLTPTVAVLSGIAELAAVAGFLVGGLLLYSRRGTAAYWLTFLAALAVWIVQIGAIAMVHWPTWLYFNDGFEFNTLILMASAAIVLLTPSPIFDRTSRKET